MESCIFEAGRDEPPTLGDFLDSQNIDCPIEGRGSLSSGVMDIIQFVERSYQQKDSGIRPILGGMVVV
jgi:hypothetical protein